MPIHILDSETIDKIAAGEVVERPASVVKELVENAMDAGATAVTVEAKDGGIELIRVTDNGGGMEREQVRTAFLRHATSKIKSAEDLMKIRSLGFRGEALSSIAAVSKAELITKTKDSLTGVRIVLEGAVEKSFDEIGAPQGTTILVRNLFFNTPVRRRFLKQPATEGGYIADLMEHLALSRPDISFKFILGNQMRFHTSGNGDLKEVIYRIYGRDTAKALLPMQFERDGVRVEGFLGKPQMVRSNRNFEIYYINGRFIKSSVVAKAVEEGYREYLMQHKFPFCVLHITLDPMRVDVNVHPTKMDVRFSDGIAFAGLLADAVRDTLMAREMIPDVMTDGSKKQPAESMGQLKKGLNVPEPFEQRRENAYRVMEEAVYQSETAVGTQKEEFAKTPVWRRIFTGQEADTGETDIGKTDAEIGGAEKTDREEGDTADPADQGDFFVEANPEPEKEPCREVGPPSEQAEANSAQLDLFEERLLSAGNRPRYQIVGQVFDTYWVVQFEEKLFIIDQHAAHEKVKYERLMKQFREKQILSQTLMPPVIVSLSGQEEALFSEYQDIFTGLGFEVEAFGGSEYALRSVPVDLYGCGEKELFLEVLDELSSGGSIRGGIPAIREKIASMSCKAAVKGNNRFSREEAERLLDELLTLENPYNCPHGRPTMLSMTKGELEKKFKRTV